MWRTVGWDGWQVCPENCPLLDGPLLISSFPRPVEGF